MSVVDTTAHGHSGAPVHAGHDHGHAHVDGLAHHFDDLQQQHGAARLGMWMFLGTEILFFGGVFVAYTAYRIWYPADFQAASSKLNIAIATINSLLLLLSSLTITFAIYAARAGNTQSLSKLLLATWLLGTAFLVFKAREYYLDFEEHLVPGASFANHEFEGMKVDGQDVNPYRVQLFFMFYYSMTAIHVLLLIVGIGLVIWLWLCARRGGMLGNRYISVEITSLYWHFVDLVWLFLVPLLYLAGAHSGHQLSEQFKLIFG
jgi:cytochrome c oxidase subunit 3